VDDLYRAKSRAELVDGELKIMDGTGFMPARAAATILLSLLDYERRTRSGYALANEAGFLVDLPNRRSFSPDAAFYRGQPTGMKFVSGAPVFAAEVRSENDYGPAAERDIAQMRADYFATGTQVVWDVDLLAEDVVRVYRAADQERPAVFRRGEVAEAEPALPGWRMPVDDLFE
jgi:Uma2 family endonuclease